MQISVLDAPTNLGLRPPSPGVEPGVSKLAGALRQTGLIKALGAREAGEVVPPAYSPEPDFAVGFRNGTAQALYGAELAARLGPLLDERGFVLVLGGDCGLLIGTGAALKARGRYGLAYIDAHDDFSFIRDTARYRGLFTLGGLSLGVATGRGPAVLADIGGLKPYFRQEDVVHIGRSSEEHDSRDYAIEDFERSQIVRLERDDIAQRGAGVIGREARTLLESDATAGFWIHLDADVLDRTLMPAVDSPNPRGLDFAQLEDVLAALLASPGAVGMEVTIFDPDLDPGGKLAQRLAGTIERAFRRSGRFALAGD